MSQSRLVKNFLYVCALLAHGFCLVDFTHPIIGDDWIGNVQVSYLPGNGVGNSSDWTKSAGSNNYENIDETGSPNLTDYNHADKVGDKDTFPHGMIPATANIIAVGVIGLFNKQAAGPAECCLVVRSGGTDHDGTNFSPPFGSNQYFQGI